MASGEESEATTTLEHEWVLWEHAMGSKDPSLWKENMKQLCSFTTVEGFWQYFTHIPKPSEVFFDGENRKRVGPDSKQIGEYSLFKKGIEPEWGDPANRTGGEWFCRQAMDSNNSIYVGKTWFLVSLERHWKTLLHLLVMLTGQE